MFFRYEFSCLVDLNFIFWAASAKF